MSFAQKFLNRGRLKKSSSVVVPRVQKEYGNTRTLLKSTCMH